jgi:hypothetical protein
MSFAQDFGDITREELELSGIDDDPEANIVILFNKGTIKISPDFNLEMEIHKRIKVLREAGKDYANVKIHFWHEDKIKDIEAVSYSPDGTKHELEDDNIFEEGSKKWKDKVFAIPGVDVGSIIEYRYTLYSDYITNLEPWFFQSTEYTKLSEICIYLPLGFKYSALEKNIVNYNFYKNSELARDPFDLREKCRKYSWQLSDVPAIKNEPYMYARHDYLAQILFQLVEYSDAYQHVSFAKQWDDIAERIWDKLEDPIEQNGDLENFVRENTIHCVTDIEKAKTLYNFVLSEIKTSSSKGFISGDFKEPKEVLKDKNAGPFGKNLLLINLLKHADLDANPLFISTRSNGQLNTSWVQLMQFNRMITYLKIGPKIYYLNPAKEYSPFGLLTPQYSVDNGLLLNESKGQIITLKPPKPKGKIKIKTDAIITGDNTMFCRSEINYSGISAVLKRADIDIENPEKYIEDDIKDSFSDAEIDSFEFVNFDSINKPLTIRVSYHIADYIEKAGHLSIFEAPLLIRKDKNPFVREKRTFAIDFPFVTNYSENIKLYFPKTMKLSEIPTRTSIKMNKLKFSKIYFKNEKNIEIIRSFRLGRTHFGSSEYKQLKQFYEKIVQSDQDKIVLEKI